MVENKTETKIVMLTIKEAAALVEGLTEYRVRQMCIEIKYRTSWQARSISSTRSFF